MKQIEIDRNFTREIKIQQTKDEIEREVKIREILEKKKERKDR